MAREWNAAAYEGLSSPQTRWGAEFLGRLELRGAEDAIDAGCGTGKVTGLLLERLPRGTVLAVDGSRAMVEAAAERFAGEPRVRVEHQDLLELEVEEPVDLVFSTATFHWIKDHERLFDRLARALKPGGRLAAQCGGEGNISRATRSISTERSTSVMPARGNRPATSALNRPVPAPRSSTFMVSSVPNGTASSTAA